MPKRLVKKRAIIELGYPFEEEEDFIIVRRALEKEHIDEIIRISENYKDEKTTYVYDQVVESAPPPALVEFVPVPAPPQSVHYAQSVRNESPSHHGHEKFEEHVEVSNHIGGPLTVLVPDRPRDDRRHEDRHYHDERRKSVTRIERDTRSEWDIKEDIRALETERRMLKYEREGDFEIIERREPRREVVRVEKDRKGRLALVRSAH